VASAALLIVLSWHLTFFQDTWPMLLDRRGFSASAFLAPHNEHLVVFQVILEKALVGAFGMTSARPEYLAMVAILMVSAVLLFVYVRRRTEDAWLALLATVLILFLGAAWPVQLWSFEIEFSAPIAAGIAALLVLDGESSRSDAWACLLMVVAVGFGSLGLSFVLAGVADVFVKRRQRGWGRIWIVAVPLVLYAIWYAGWGHEAVHHLTLENVLKSPTYVFEGFATAIGALAGFGSANTVAPAPPDWGRPILIGLIGVAAFAKWRRPGVPKTFWPVAVAAVSYWLLAAFNFTPGREASSSRYIYAGAVFILMLATELMRGTRVSRRALPVLGAIVVIMVLPNLVLMKEGSDWLREQSVLTRADTGAIDIASRTVAPSFGLTPEVAGTGSLINIVAEKYLPLVHDYGSPGYSPAELARAPEAGRRQADIVLASALPLRTTTMPNAYRSSVRPGCSPIPADPESEIALSAGVTRIELPPGPQVKFALRRFAVGEYPVLTEPTPGGAVAFIHIPADNATQPWMLHIEPEHGARVCPGAG
jgi:hypothetical protein